MRALLGSTLIATACLAGAGCASKPAEETPVASMDTAAIDQACANAAGNSLHLTSTSSASVIEHDTAIDSILSQPVSDVRLAQINRRMYQSLRSLDAELRREQVLAACAQKPTLEAQSSHESGAATGSAGGAADTAPAGVASGASTSVPVARSAVGTVGSVRALRKTSLSPGTGGGGNGATAPKIVPGSDNDVVARRLRKAAEQETNPSLRAKLWKEYTDYRQGSSAK